MESDSKKWIIFAIIFVAVASSLIYFAFFDDGITGFTIFDRDDREYLEDFEGRDIIADLNHPGNLSLSGIINSIAVEAEEGSIISIGGNNANLSGMEEIAVDINGFKGDLFFGDSEIFVLEGFSDKVSINGMTFNNVDIGIRDSFSYDLLGLEGFSLDSLNYNATGQLSIEDGKTTTNLNHENFELEGFFGNLVIDEKFRLDGNFDSLKTEDIFIEK